MRHVNRLGGAARNGRNQRSRSMALLATFLLLVAGAIVSAAPGLMSAGATSGSTTEQGENEHECEAEDGHHHGNETEDESQAQDQSQAENQNKDDGDNDADDNDGDNDADDNDNDNQNCLATLTVFKTIGDDTHGGFLTGDDFQLLVDGVPKLRASRPSCLLACTSSAKSSRPVTSCRRFCARTTTSTPTYTATTGPSTWRPVSTSRATSS